MTLKIDINCPPSVAPNVQLIVSNIDLSIEHNKSNIKYSSSITIIKKKFMFLKELN